MERSRSDGFLLNVTSKQPDMLRDWYHDVLQLPELEGGLVQLVEIPRSG